MRKLLLAFLLPALPCFALFVGNPADPSLYSKGYFLGRTLFSLRLGAYGDTMLRQKFKDEFPIPGISSSPSYLSLLSSGGSLALNYNRRFDLYTLLGSSRSQVDHEIYSRRTFSWGVGAKWAFLVSRCFRMGLNAQYFQSEQRPAYFLGNGAPYNVAAPYTLTISDLQGAFGFTYKIGFLSPYINATYFYTKIEPNPLRAVIQDPFDPSTTLDADSKSVVSNRRFGMTLGATILSAHCANVNIEARMLNQNGVSLSGELRF